MPQELRLNFATLPQQQRVTPEPTQEIISSIGQGEKALANAYGEAIQAAQGQFQLADQKRKEGLQDLNEGVDTLLKERKVNQLIDSQELRTEFLTKQAQIAGDIKNNPQIKPDQIGAEYEKQITALRQEFQQRGSRFDRDVLASVQEKFEEGVAKSSLHLRDIASQRGLEARVGSIYKSIEEEKSKVALTPEEITGKLGRISSLQNTVNELIDAGAVSPEKGFSLKEKIKNDALVSSFLAMSETDADATLKLISSGQIAELEKDPQLKRQLKNTITEDIESKHRKERQRRQDEREEREENDRKVLEEEVGPMLARARSISDYDAINDRVRGLLAEGKISLPVANQWLGISTAQVDRIEGRNRQAIQDDRSTILFNQGQQDRKRLEDERESIVRQTQLAADTASGKYNSYAEDTDNFARLRLQWKAEGYSENEINKGITNFAQKAELLKDPIQRQYNSEAEKLAKTVDTLFPTTSPGEMATPGSVLATQAASIAKLNIQQALQTELLQAKKENRPPKLQEVFETTLAANASGLTKKSEQPYDLSILFGSRYKDLQTAQQVLQGSTDPALQQELRTLTQQQSIVDILNKSTQTNLQTRVEEQKVRQEELAKQAQRAQLPPSTPTTVQYEPSGRPTLPSVPLVVQEAQSVLDFRPIANLSTRFESGGNPGIQNKTSTAIGKYQFFGATEQGQVLQHLKSSGNPKYAEIAQQLEAAGAPASQPFRDAWTRVANSPLRNFFEQAQDEVAKKNYWDPIASYGQNRSMIAKQVMFATSIHMGVGGVESILKNSTQLSDRELIDKLYQQRIAKAGADAPNVEKEREYALSFFSSNAGWVPGTSSAEAQKKQKEQEAAQKKQLEEERKKAEEELKKTQEKLKSFNAIIPPK